MPSKTPEMIGKGTENRVWENIIKEWEWPFLIIISPCLSLPDEKGNRPIGLWGQRHLRYLKQHRKVLYTNLLTSGKLNSLLAEIDKQAEDMFFRVVKHLAEKEGVTEKLKAENQMEWVFRMNNIRSRVTEIVNHDIIYN